MALYLREEPLNKILDISGSRMYEYSKKNDLGSFIQKLQRRENQMLKQYFGAKTTREKLLKRFEKVKKQYPQLDNLGGEALRWTTTMYLSKVGDEAAKEELEFHKIINEAWDNWNPQLNDKDKTVENFFLHIVESTRDIIQEIEIGGRKSSGRVTSLRSLKNKELSQVHLTDLAPVTQARVRYYLNNLYKKNNLVSSLVKRGNIDPDKLVEAKNDTVTVDYNFLDWHSLTKGNVASSVSFSKEEAESLISQFKQKILDYLKGITNQQVVEKVVDFVFKENLALSDPTQTVKYLFVGKNEKGITGLCGEIRALIYLSFLLEEDFDVNKTTFLAPLKDKISKQQYHSDIAILQEFGIQVKNSLDNSFKESIDFTDSNLTTFLDRLSNTGIIGQAKEAIINVVQAYFFNVSYKAIGSVGNRKKNREEDEQHYKVIYGAGENIYFENTRERIEALFEALEIFFCYLIGQLMYIGLGNAMNNEDANVMYFIGNEILFASEIVKNIYDNIDRETRDFQTKLTYNSSYTIIDYINSVSNGTAFHQDHINSDKVINAVHLVSSYNFAGLLKNLH